MKSAAQIEMLIKLMIQLEELEKISLSFLRKSQMTK